MCYTTNCCRSIHHLQTDYVRGGKLFRDLNFSVRRRMDFSVSPSCPSALFRVSFPAKQARMYASCTHICCMYACLLHARMSVACTHVCCMHTSPRRHKCFPSTADSACAICDAGGFSTATWWAPGLFLPFDSLTGGGNELIKTQSSQREPHLGQMSGDGALLQTGRLETGLLCVGPARRRAGLTEEPQ